MACHSRVTVTATAQSLVPVHLGSRPGEECVAIHTLPFGYQTAEAMDPKLLLLTVLDGT